MSNSRTTFITTLGTLLEWAEYTFFAYMADQLSKLFFDIHDPTLALLKTYAIFATSYFLRPLGALIFGSIGDRLGRKPALMSSMLLMGFATVAIGFLPTFKDVGVLASILLLLCRLLQGLAVGGEFHGAVTFLHEHANKKPFQAGSFAPFAAAAGMAVGAFSASLTNLKDAPEFAWRIPFLCSGFLCLLAMYLRTHIKETPAFQEAKRLNRLVRFPILKAFQENKKALLMSASIALFIAIYVYIGNVFYKILCMKAGFDAIVASQIVTFGQVLAAISILTVGKYADKIGGKKLCSMGLCFAVFAGPFILWCGQTGDITFSVLGQIFYAVINGLVSAPMMTLLMRQFNTESRYSGSAFGWSASTAIFGGTALLAAETLTTQLNFKEGPGLYISLAALIAFVMVRTSTGSVASTANTESELRTARI